MTIYLKPTGSTCYDKTGITYPPNSPKFDIEGVAVERFGQDNVHWEHLYGWTNLPKVLIITGKRTELNEFVKYLNSTYGNFFVGIQTY